MAEDTLLSEMHIHGINQSSREIYLHGHYSSYLENNEEPGVEYKMATTFVKNLHYLQDLDDESILIHMHTIGGSWNDGIAIFNSVEYSPNIITILVYSHARSMSSVILQSADHRIMMPDSDFMIHHGWSSAEGSTLACISAFNFEKKLVDRMINIYAKKCINGEFFQSKYKSVDCDRVKTYLKRKMRDKGDWWMSSEEAVYYGFADGILGDDNYSTMEFIRSI